MRKEAFLKALKKRSVFCIIYGIVTFLLGVLLSMALVLGEAGPMVLLGIFFIGGGVYLVWFGIDCGKGLDSRLIKKQENILELVEDLDRNPVYQDDFICVSEKAIASCKNPLQVKAREDILGIYEEINRTNGITTRHVIKLQVRDKSNMEINVYAKKKNTKTDIMLTIAGYCPNAKVGFSSETLAYVKEQQKIYKEAHKKK